MGEVKNMFDLNKLKTERKKKIVLLRKNWIAMRRTQMVHRLRVW